MPTRTSGSGSGLRGGLLGVDGRRVGTRHAVLGFGFLLLGGVQGLVIRAQLMAPEGQLLEPGEYASLFTLHGVTMVFLAALPLSLAFASWRLPTLLGAPDLRLPRLQALGSWLVLAGGLLLNAGLARWLLGARFAEAVPGLGWSGIAALAGLPPGRAVDAWLVGFQLLALGFAASALGLLATLLARRPAPSPTAPTPWPVFAWCVLAAQALALPAFALPALGLLPVLGERLLAASPALPPAALALLARQLDWLFGAAVPALLLLAALGILAEVLPGPGRRLAAAPLAIGAALVLAGATLADGLLRLAGEEVSGGPLAPRTLALAAPAAVFGGCGLASWLTRPRLDAARLFGLGALGLLAVAGASGVLQASRPGSYLVVAHLHFAAFGVSVLALFAGAYRWWPALFGRRLDEGLGRLHFALWFVALNATFLPMFALGLDGMPRRSASFPAGAGWTTANLVASLGAYLLGSSLAVFAWNLARTRREAPPEPPPAPASSAAPLLAAAALVALWTLALLR